MQFRIHSIGGFMFTQEDRIYVKSLLIDRQARLNHALLSNDPHSVLQPDPFTVQVELDHVTAVLNKIRSLGQ